MLASELALAALLTTGIAALDWTEIKAPSTARVTALTAVGKTLLAGTDKGAVFRSEDGGESWTKSILPAGYPVLSFSTSDDTVRAMRSEYYYPTSDCFGYCRFPTYPEDIAESRNGGRDWSEFRLELVTHMTRSRDGALWAISRDSVYYRPPGAQAWIGRRFAFAPDPLQSRPTGNCHGLAALPGSLYALLDSYIYRIDTGFSADTLRPTQIRTSLAYGLYADSTRVVLNYQDGVYGTGSPQVSLLGRSPSLGWMGRGETGILALSRSDGYLYRSLDHGGTWIRIGAPRLPDSTFDVAEAGGVIAAAVGTGNGRLLVSAQGKDWQPAGSGLFESPVTPVLVHGGTIWALTHLGLVHAPLAGGAWVTEADPTIGSEYFGMAAAGGKIWAGSDYGLWSRDSASGNWAQLFRKPVTALAVSGDRIAAAVGSDNGGKRQNLVTLCGGDGICRDSPTGLMGVTTPDAYYRYVRGRMDFLAARGDTLLASDTLLYRSRDGGRTWDTAYDWGYYRPAAIAWAGGGLFAVRDSPGCPGCLWRSENLGASWEAVDSLRGTGQPWSLLSDGNRLYLLSKSGLYSSPDGSHWIQEDATAWSARPSSIINGGYLALGDGEGHSRIAKLPAAPLGMVPRPARATAKPGTGFRDRLGRPRRADGSLGKGPAHQ